MKKEHNLCVLKYNNLKKDFFGYDSFKEKPAVCKITADVQKNGDRALRHYTLKFDHVALKNIKVGSSEIKNAYSKVKKETIYNLKKANKNIEKFSKVQLRQLKDFRLEVESGVIAGQKVIPINRIGIYTPGGRFPLVSAVLMCTVPAKVAGVKEIALCSPPTYNGSIHPAILVAADMVGISEIYKVGGAQAIAALAYGTETVKSVDKIFGPGNIYVNEAKKEIFGQVGIDFIAGPTEILIIADKYANPEILAVDLLAQAEHDINAVPVLITNSLGLAQKVNSVIKKRLGDLKTKDVAQKSLKKNGVVVIVDSIRRAIEIANKKAPEHLELQVKNPAKYLNLFKNYGSLFIGEYSAEVLGDYSSGLNHTLPTGGAARYTGGLHIKDFLKIQTMLRVTKKGFSMIAPIAKYLSEIEGLDAHVQSIIIREIKK